MERPTLDALRTLARAQGLDLSEEELQGLLPLVEAGRAMMQPLDQALPPEVEPTVQYRLF